MHDDAAVGHRADFDVGDESVVRSVAVSVAAVAGMEPTALPPLQRAVDTDALEALVRSAATSGTSLSVRFRFADHRVSVDAEGSIHVAEPDARG